MSTIRQRGLAVALVAILVAGCGSTPGASVGQGSSSAGPSSPVPASAPASASASAPVAPSLTAAASAGGSASLAATPGPSTAPSQPAGASASPAPSASAPIDAAHGLAAILRDPKFYAAADISGIVQTSSARYGMTGTLRVSGASSDQLIEVRRPGSAPIERVVAWGATYERRGTGPYFRLATASATLAGFLGAVTVGTDAGVESKGGRSLHHLALAVAGQPVAAFAIADATVGPVTWTADAWTSDDGTPAVIEIKGAWAARAAKGTSAASLRVVLSFTSVGEYRFIGPPDDVWVTFTSKRYGYQVTMPAGWTFHPSKSAKKYDEMFGPDSLWAEGDRYPAYSWSLDSFARYQARAQKKDYTKYKLEAITSTSLAGLPAKLVSWHDTYRGNRYYFLWVLVLKGGQFHEFAISDIAGHEAADRRLMARIAAMVVLK